MAIGIKALRQIQMSREASTAQGTATTDFVIWRGTGVLTDTREPVFVTEDIGILPGVDRQYFATVGGELVMDDIEATFEQLGHIFDAAFYKATPTSDAAGSGWIRTYTLPIQSTDIKESTDLQTYSFKMGDNVAVDKAGFGFVREFSLSGNAGEALKVNATWQTREVTTDTGFETGLALPTVEEILFPKASLYLDLIGGTIGATQVSNILLSAEVAVTTGWQAVYAASGRIDFSFIKQVQPEILLTVTFEHNSDAVTEKGYWKAGTARLLRLKFEGNALASAGDFTYKTLIVDLAGKWESFEGLGDQDGNDTVTGVFRARYNSTAAKFAEFKLVNDTATL